MWLYILLLWVFFLGAGFLLAAALPMDISDRRKLQVMEFLLRIANEYLGDLVEKIAGPVVRNKLLRFWMGLGFLIPLPSPKNIKIHDEKMRSVRVRCYEPTTLLHNSAIVFIHGGGWATMRPDYYDSMLFWFVDYFKIKIYSIDYRLAPEHPYPAAVEDCVAVVEHLNERANDYGIDGQKIALFGDSAGGNLAAVVAQKLKNRKCIVCQVLVYPVTSVFSFNLPSYQEYHKTFKGTALLNPKAMARWILMYVGLPAHAGNVKKMMRSKHLSKDLKLSSDFEKFLEPEFLKKRHSIEEFGSVVDVEEDKELAEKFKKALDPGICPIFGVTGDLPPAFIVTCGYDVLRDEGIIYHNALRKAGVPTGHLHIPRGFHGLLNMPSSNMRLQMTSGIASYLKNYLK